MPAGDPPAQSGRLRSILARLVRPADDWAFRANERRTSILSVLMSVLLGVLGAMGLLVFGFLGTTGDGWLLATFSLLLVASVLIVAVLMFQVRRHLVKPLSQLYTWALRMCDGDLSARIPTPQVGRFEKLSFHINRLSEALDRLANEMDDLVWEQTNRLQRKNQSLELLYEIAAAVSTTDDLTEVLEQAVSRVLDVLGGTGGSVYLCNVEGSLELLTTVGEAWAPDRAPPDTEASPPIPRQVDVPGSGANHEAPLDVRVPLIYRERDLGLIRLYLRPTEPGETPELIKLLASVGNHLAMAIAKFKLDEESRNLNLVRERASLAYELHDSLAQTIAALRFQMRNLDETLGPEQSLDVRREIRRIRSSMDEVNTEVRELIASFRTPLDERGVLRSIEDMTLRFRKDTGIAAYFHADAEGLVLPPAAEMQVLGIVREALTNVRKHSKAHMVRVLLQPRGSTGYRLLVEDDGVGMTEPVVNSHPGEHIGLSIMQDRARRLGGELRIESEPGDGTRIDLLFEVGPAHTRGVLGSVG